MKSTEKTFVEMDDQEAQICLNSNLISSFILYDVLKGDNKISVSEAKKTRWGLALFNEYANNGYLDIFEFEGEMYYKLSKKGIKLFEFVGN